MKMQRTLRRTILAMALAALATGASAQLTVTEVEPNGSILPEVDGTNGPQDLRTLSSGAITVQGSLDNTGMFADGDFYSFVPQVDMDVRVSIKGDALSKIALYDGVTFETLATAPEMDTALNPQIEHGLVAGRTYIVSVNATGELLHSYVMTIAALAQEVPPPPAPEVPPPPLEAKYINIDIKPGQRQRARINPESKAPVAVALLSSRTPTFTFNAPADVNPATLTFGASGTEPSFRSCVKRGYDVNKDGLPDLVCFFRKDLGAFERGHNVGKLKGQTYGGVAFEGKGDLKVVAERKKRHDHDRHRGDRHRHDRDRDHDRDRKRHRDRDD
jgi:hypothetical protein